MREMCRPKGPQKVRFFELDPEKDPEVGDFLVKASWRMKRGERGSRLDPDEKESGPLEPGDLCLRRPASIRAPHEGTCDGFGLNPF